MLVRFLLDRVPDQHHKSERRPGLETSLTHRRENGEHDTTKKAARRQRATTALYAAGMDKVAQAFDDCGKFSFVEVCESHVDHAPRIIPKTCKLRICENCERRESARKLRRYYLPILDMSDQQLPGFQLRKMVLTTPCQLESLTAASYALVWDDVHKFLDTLFFRVLDALGMLSSAEKRRGRADLKKHGIGALAAAEFGPGRMGYVGRKLHFHLLMYCPWLEHKDLRALWTEVTGGVCNGVRINLVGLHDIVSEIQEMTKYVTKFTELPPELIPHLASVLKGNRRFRTYGLLNCLPKADRDAKCKCEVCGANRNFISLLSYLHLCEVAGVPPDDAIIDDGEARLFNFSSEQEISLGKHPHRARDSIEGD